MEVKIENAGACKKKLTITIPREDLDKKLEERFTDLQKEAQIPGFRPGHAPRRLVEKRFHEAVADEVRASMAADAFKKAVEDEKLDIIGEPDMGPEAIQTPDDGPMTLTVELEVRPEFELPDYVGIPVAAQRKALGDEELAHTLEHLRDDHAPLEPVAEGDGAKEDDYVAADITIKVGEEVVVDQKDARFPLKATAVQGIRLADVPQWLAGAKVGETRTGTFKIGDEAEREDLRGKDAEASFTLNDLRRAGAITDEELLKAIGYESMDALKASLKRQLDAQADLEFRRAQEGAIRSWLMEHAPFELPEELAKHHAAQLLRRTLVNLQYRGVPVEEIEKRLADIQSASAARAIEDLKLSFILDKIAVKEKIEATDAEVDARLRFIAAQYNRKEDRVREEMESQGTMDSLRSQIREDKVMRMLLEKAKVAGEPEKPAEPQTT